jgi:hypothetical protein
LTRNGIIRLTYEKANGVMVKEGCEDKKITYCRLGRVDEGADCKNEQNEPGLSIYEPGEIGRQ